MEINGQSTFVPVDFSGVGKSMGTGGARATTLDEVKAGLTQAMACKGPFVLDVLSSDIATSTVEFEIFSEEKGKAGGAYGLG